MVPANNVNQWLVPTQLLGASIQATLIVLPVVCGLQLLLRRFGYGQLVGTQAAVLILFVLTWAALFLSGPAGRWPKINQVLADPTKPMEFKIKATLTNWFSLLLIVANVVWVLGSAIGTIPLFPS